MSIFGGKKKEDKGKKEHGHDKAQVLDEHGHPIEDDGHEEEHEEDDDVGEDHGWFGGMGNGFLDAIATLLEKGNKGGVLKNVEITDHMPVKLHSALGASFEGAVTTQVVIKFSSKAKKAIADAKTQMIGAVKQARIAAKRDIEIAKLPPKKTE